MFQVGDQVIYRRKAYWFQNAEVTAILSNGKVQIAYAGLSGQIVKEVSYASLTHATISQKVREGLITAGRPLVTWKAPDGLLFKTYEDDPDAIAAGCTRVY